MVTYILLFVGLIFLFFGGEVLLRGALVLAKRFGISELVIGLTIVGFGTSMPELLVSLQAAWIGQPDISIGNVVGSNIANILLILGASALVYPLSCTPAMVFRDGSIMIAFTILFIVLGNLGVIAFPSGLILFLCLLAYLSFTYWNETRNNVPSAELRIQEAELLKPKEQSILLGIVYCMAGLGLLIWGSNLLVENAVLIAKTLGMSERFIGLTLVAVGTSLPELATSLVASFRGNANVAVGNVIGSNIFNLLGIIGITAMVHPIAVSPAIIQMDFWIMLAVSIGLLPFLWTGWKLNRIEGGIFLVVYVVYIGALLR